MYEAIFDTYRFKVAFDDFEQDIQNLDSALRQRLNREQLASVHTVEMLKSVFYRGKAAYLVGRICMPTETLPFVIALQMTEKRNLMVDALLTERPHMSNFWLCTLLLHGTNSKSSRSGRFFTRATTAQKEL
jgi:isocitrate dehydrogenase kinase/phosphatase